MVGSGWDKPGRGAAWIWSGRRRRGKGDPERVQRDRRTGNEDTGRTRNEEVVDAEGKQEKERGRQGVDSR